MKFCDDCCLLYAVTDRGHLNGVSLLEAVEKAISGGATMVQFRDKNISKREAVKICKELSSLCKVRNIPFIVNDDAEIAVESGADGVHLGQSDGKVSCVRAKYPDLIIGASAHNLSEALMAQSEGADYLGVGAVFPSPTKSDAEIVDIAELKKICSAVSIPVVSIGGINCENVRYLKDSGVKGIAVVSAIFSKNDITAETEKLKKIAAEILL